MRRKSRHQTPAVSAGKTQGTFLMELFREQFDFIDSWLAERADRNQLTTIADPGPVTWPTAGQRNLIAPGISVGIRFLDCQTVRVILVI